MSELPTSEEPDEIDDLYRRASALDSSRPSDSLRRAVLEHAATLARQRSAEDIPARLGAAPEAANQGWRRPALYGSLAAAPTRRPVDYATVPAAPRAQGRHDGTDRSRAAQRGCSAAAGVAGATSGIGAAAEPVAGDVIVAVATAVGAAAVAGDGTEPEHGQGAKFGRWRGELGGRCHWRRRTRIRRRARMRGRAKARGRAKRRVYAQVMLPAMRRRH